MSDKRITGVPERWTGRTDEHLRKIAAGVNELFKGHSNNHYRVTLRKGTTVTTVHVPGITAQVVPTITALDAVCARTMGGIYAVAERNQVKIHHESNPEDRLLGLIVVG